MLDADRKVLFQLLGRFLGVLPEKSIPLSILHVDGLLAKCVG
jgi:hypothetical protein